MSSFISKGDRAGASFPKSSKSTDTTPTATNTTLASSLHVTRNRNDPTRNSRTCRIHSRCVRGNPTHRHPCAQSRLARDRPTHHSRREGSEPRVPSLATAQKRQRLGHLYRYESAQAGCCNTNERRNRCNSPRVYRSRLRGRKRIERDSEIRPGSETKLRSDDFS